MKRSRGFTLIELLVVIAIMAALGAVVFGVAGTAMRKAKSATCSNRLRQVAAGLTSYASENGGIYPFRKGNERQGSGTYGRWSDVVLRSMGVDRKDEGSDKIFTDPFVKNHWEFKEGAGMITDFGVNDVVIVNNETDGSSDLPVPVRTVNVLDPSNTVLVCTAQYGKDPTRGFWWVDGALHVSDTWSNARARPAARFPGERTALAFCDGHVETLAWKQLVAEGQRRFQLRYDPTGSKK